jgi:hypothetical protein
MAVQEGPGITTSAAPSGGNWFDSFSKTVALGRISRRTVVGGIFGLAGLKMGGMGLAREPRAQVPPERPGECLRAGRGGTIREEAMVAAGGLDLRTVREAMPGPRPHYRLSRTLSRRSRPLYELEIEARSECDFFITLRLGRDVLGARSIIVQGRPDGGMRGEIDGRVFGLSAGATSIDEAHFADGLPRPRITFPNEQELAAAGPELAAAERRALASCAGVQEAVTPRPAEQSLRTFSTMSGRAIVVREKSPSNWSPPLGQGAPTCTRCHNRCGDSYADCVGDDALDIILNIVSAGGRVAACLAKWGLCAVNCSLPGEGCCPVLCGDVFSGSCCGEGKQCIGTYGCCQAGQVVCRESCCNPGVSRCGPDGYCGCPDPYRECGANDCFDPRSQICCNGWVCPPGSTCVNGSCCRGRVCADGNCCDLLGSTCCGGTCCLGQCINNSCCPQERVCGSACCAPGQECLDRGQSICGTLAPANCGPRGLSLQRPCRSTLSDGRLVSTCCTIWADCCNGQCCGIGEICCWYTGRCQPSRYVCGPN